MLLMEKSTSYRVLPRIGKTDCLDFLVEAHLDNVFIGSSRKLIKLLHAEDGGMVMYVKRLEAGRFRQYQECHT